MLGKSTVVRGIKKSLSEEENIKLGCPSKLSSIDKRRIVSSITSKRAENACPGSPLIHSAHSAPVSSQTIHNVLKSVSLKAVVKKKRPFFSVKHRDRD